MLLEALRRTYGDPSILWRAPMLAIATMTGIGAFFTLGYAFSVQDHIARGGDEYPDVDLDYVWYGIKFAIAIIVLLVPVFLLFAGVGLPALLDVGEAGITGSSVEAAWEASAGSVLTFAALGGTWLLALAAAMPGMMIAFVEADGRIFAVLNPASAIRPLRSAPADYGRLLLVVAGWIVVSLLLYVPLEIALPSGSVVPMLAVAFLIVPFAMSVLMLVQVMLGIMRRCAYEEASLDQVGWHHLHDQHPSGSETSEEGSPAEATPGEDRGSETGLARAP